MHLATVRTFPPVYLRALCFISTRQFVRQARCCSNLLTNSESSNAFGCYLISLLRFPLSVWPHLFRGAGHEKRMGEQLKWFLPFRLYIGSFPCAQLPGPVHTARLGRVLSCVFSLGLCFVCSFVLFDLFVCLHSSMFLWAVESSPLQFLALA